MVIVAGRSTQPLDRTKSSHNMRIEYKVGVWDIVKFNLVQQARSLLTGGLFLAFAVFVFVNELGSGHSVPDAALTALWWFIGMWMLQALIVFAFLYTKSADSVLTEHVLEIRDTGLFERTRFNESLFFWPSVIKVVRGPGYVAVFISARQAHVIPRAAFQSREHQAQFIAAIGEKRSAV
jgi:hypothetical protein